VYSVCHVLAVGADPTISVAVNMVDFTTVQNSRAVAGVGLQTHQCHSSFSLPDCQGTLGNSAGISFKNRFRTHFHGPALLP
jgi:hypothetical protein